MTLRVSSLALEDVLDVATPVEPALIGLVQFPDMRRQVISALASLADTEYQERSWVRKIFPAENYYEDLRLEVNVLYEDFMVLPSPADSVGDGAARR